MINPARKLEPRRALESPLRAVKGQSEREVRRLKLDRAKELLSGKISTVWIYAISSSIKP